MIELDLELVAVRQRRAQSQRQKHLARNRAALLRCQLAPRRVLQDLEGLQHRLDLLVSQLSCRESAILAELDQVDAWPETGR